MLVSTMSEVQQISRLHPKKLLIKVKGRKMNVIHDKRHMLVLSCKEWRLSRISTDLYIRSARLAVGFTRSSCIRLNDFGVSIYLLGCNLSRASSLRS